MPMAVLAGCRFYRQPSPEERGPVADGAGLSPLPSDVAQAPKPPPPESAPLVEAVESPGAAAADALRLWTLNRDDAVAESAVRLSTPAAVPSPERFAFVAWGVGSGVSEACVPPVLQEVTEAIQAGVSPERALADALVLAVQARWGSGDRRVFALLRGTDGHLGSVQGDPQTLFSRERLLSAWRRRAALGGGARAVSLAGAGDPVGSDPRSGADGGSDAGVSSDASGCAAGALSGPVVLGAVGAQGGLALVAALVADPDTDEAWPYLAQPTTLFREPQPNQLLVLVSDCPAHLGPNLEALTPAAGRVEPSGCRDAFIEFSAAGALGQGAAMLLRQRTFSDPPAGRKGDRALPPVQSVDLVVSEPASASAGLDAGAPRGPFAPMAPTGETAPSHRPQSRTPSAPASGTP